MAFYKRKPLAAMRRSNVPDGLWVKCPACKQLDYRSELEVKLRVCTHCGYHHRIGARTRIAMLVDPATFEETHTGLRSGDPLDFSVGEDRYTQRVARAQQATQLEDALVTGTAEIEGTPLALGVMDPNFMMASMGGAVGERFCRFAEDAIQARLPVVVFAASGGARMQEGILALMQMAKTAEAVRALNAAAVPYVVVMTDPTSGGVFASFASLGDMTFAEPGAYIGFAGARLIEGALGVKLPPGFQRAEYQFENGFVDRIVPRAEMRPFLGRLLRYIAPAPAA